MTECDAIAALLFAVPVLVVVVFVVLPWWLGK